MSFVEAYELHSTMATKKTDSSDDEYETYSPTTAAITNEMITKAIPLGISLKLKKKKDQEIRNRRRR